MKIPTVPRYQKPPAPGKIRIMNVGGKALWIYVIYEKAFLLSYMY